MDPYLIGIFVGMVVGAIIVRLFDGWLWWWKEYISERIPNWVHRLMYGKVD